MNGIAYFKKNTTDSKILDQLRILDTTIKTSASIEPATEVLLETEKQIQSVLQEKQSEIRKLAKTIKQYPKFLASIEHNDVALVSDKDIDITFKTPLFVANESTKKLIASQDSPTKAYLDTNSTLVTSYLNTLKSSTPSQLQMDTVTYNKATSYLQNVRSKIDTAYNRL
ncbi:TPA: hypothetical protein DEP21_05735 [Patescibacteria group bacterium]|nr:hypothetical protein [Candidatus Gracilibacteria bacterium]